MKSIILLSVGLCLTILLQAQVSKTATNTAGKLAIVLTAEELHTITNLTLKGTMDARDFKTIRDDMPRLAVLNMKGVEIVAFKYTISTYPVLYAANSIPPVYINGDILYSLSHLTHLTSVIFPPSLTSIGYGSFSGCTGLTSMDIPPTVDTIRNEAFMDCSGITSFILPPAMTEIGPKAFKGCIHLASIELPTGISTIKESTFVDCKSLKSINIPQTVISIGTNAFSGCSGLTTVIIPPSVTVIGTEAFSGCVSLAKAGIPSSIIFIESGAFLECSGLTSVTIPESVKSIGQVTFCMFFILRERRKKTTAAENGKITIYRIKSIDQVMRDLPPQLLEELKAQLVGRLIEQKTLRRFRFQGRYYFVAVDATGIQTFTKRHCEHCLTRTSKKDVVTYFHYALEAKLVS